MRNREELEKAVAVQDFLKDFVTSFVKSFIVSFSVNFTISLFIIGIAKALSGNKDEQ